MQDIAFAATIIGVAWAIAWARVKRLRIEADLWKHKHPNS